MSFNKAKPVYIRRRKMKPRTMFTLDLGAQTATGTSTIKDPTGDSKIDEIEIRITRMEIYLEENAMQSGDWQDWAFFLVRGPEAAPLSTMASVFNEVTGPDRKYLGIVRLEYDTLTGRYLVRKPNFRIEENQYAHLVFILIGESSNVEVEMSYRLWYKKKIGS